MYPRCFLVLQLILITCAQDIDVIRDYFLFKRAARVAGFSCGDIENDYKTIRMLSDVGIAASIKSLKSDVNVTQFLHTEYWSLGVFLDLRCSSSDKNVERIFYETSVNYMYGHLHHWLILGNNMSHAVKALNDSAFSITTDLVISLPRNDSYQLYDAYNHCKLRGGSLNITKFGTWRNGDGLNVTLLEGKFTRRWDYHGMKVKTAGIVLYRPKDQGLIEYLQDENSVIMDNWPKFGYSVLVHVAEMFNFTFEMIELNRWEKNDSNGPLMSGLKRNSFDLGYYPSIITIERLNYARVITQVWPQRTCFMFRTEPSLKMNMNIIFRPFEANVWYMISLMLLLTISVLSAILKVEKVDDGSDYGVTILITVAAMCQQGLPSFTEKCASRVAFLQIMFFSVLVYNYYSAAIVSSRLNAPLDKMNDSLYSLVKSGMKLAAEKNVFFNILLRYPSEEVQYFRRHWETIPEWKRFQPVEEGIKKITKSGFAYHADPTDAYPFIERIFSKQMICQLTEVHLLRPQTIGLWSSRNAYFREVAKIGLLRISTAGIRKRQVRRWSSRKPYCNKDKLYVSSVTIHEAGPIIIILIFGVILSLVILFIENIVFRVLRRREKDVVVRNRDKLNVTRQKNVPSITWSQNKIAPKARIFPFMNQIRIKMFN